MNELHEIKMISIITENCVGCRICELTCSFYHFDTFNPSKSRIKISNIYDTKPEIEFSDECIECGLCAKNCLYGALIVKGEYYGD